jgi:sulfonate transport system ATP-binding protein
MALSATAMAAATARPEAAPAHAERGATITARGLGKAFGAKPVLRGLDLSISAGEFLAVVGRSGCGKSTLLRLLAGLETPSHGRIAVGDRAEVDTRTIARVMFQEPRLLPWARVLANVEVGLGADRRSLAGRARALEALASVGLADRANDWPSVLSGGQKQRVALARALVSRPRVLALDEPLGALDALTRIEMQQLIEAAWRREGFTSVFVTHDVAEAVALADRIVLIEQGTIALDVPVDLQRPRHRGAPEFGALEERILDRLLGAGEA